MRGELYGEVFMIQARPLELIRLQGPYITPCMVDNDELGCKLQDFGLAQRKRAPKFCRRLFISNDSISCLHIRELYGIIYLQIVPYKEANYHGK